MAKRLSRRTVLRGAGGVAVALPVLECMLNDHGTAYAAGTGEIPCRYAIIFAGQSIGGDGYAPNENRVAGMNFTETGHQFAPAQTGTGYTPTTPHEPLTQRNLQNDYSVVSNMNIPWNPAASDGGSVPSAGAFRDFHGGVCSPLLSGTRSTSPSYTCNGITSDQVIAQMNAGQALGPDSLLLRVQPSWYLSGSSYSGRQYLSYSDANQELDAQVSPQIAYMSLFGGFTPDNADDIAALDFALRSRRSVLDLITAKREALLGKVGAADKVRLEKHFNQIRELEMRISAIDPTAASCEVPPDPGADPPIGGDNAGSGSGNIGTNTGWSEETTRGMVMADLIHMAFTCDLTRSAVMQISVFQSHMNMFVPSSDLGLPMRADLHEVGHNGDTENRGQLPVSTNLKWHIDFYAHLVEKLKNTTEGAGSVLDNCAILFVPEGGHGTQLNDGSSANQAHCVEGMCQLIAGGAGGLKMGEHIDAGGAHPVQHLITAMQAVGYTGDTLGEVTGTIPGLL